jgi:hypothetical protein
MARQVGLIKITGTIDDLVFYESGGEYYVRKKPSINRRRYKRSPRFANSRRSNERFGGANRVASGVYTRIRKEARRRDLYRYLASRAIQLMKEGLDPAAVEDRLFQYLYRVGVPLIEELLPACWHAAIDQRSPSPINQWTDSASLPTATGYVPGIGFGGNGNSRHIYRPSAARLPARWMNSHGAHAFPNLPSSPGPDRRP